MTSPEDQPPHIRAEQARAQIKELERLLEDAIREHFPDHKRVAQRISHDIEHLKITVGQAEREVEIDRWRKAEMRGCA